eukprot:TRINITY_DN49321_c0_g1_i1.p1 TRINITY_DN49321_c0_g1~~TRINITY_DN49321_c0_g1_i1.p1  ORF type:complete len:368 (-),score=84.19 TRINITY_DN49321_c0_g1_i1:367-1470(-)
MPLSTTVIGSFPKPEYLELPDWFKTGTAATSDSATKQYTKILESQSDADKKALEESLMRATRDVIQTQIDCGIDVVTDGEVRRENYIHYLCRFIEGIDFENLTETSCRNGAYVTALPTIRGAVSWRGPLDVAAEWKKAQGVSDRPVKYTLPGPMTIIGTLSDAHYNDDPKLAADLAAILNVLVRRLAEAGCTHIQIDEPLFARKPDSALAFGIQMLDRCFEGVGPDVRKDMHMCCGYPGYLDQQDYQKADSTAYLRLAEALDNSSVDAVSIEDAHRYNDLKLLSKFTKTKVIFGSVTIASSRIEPVEEIEERLLAALEYIDEDRLIVAPDCGLAFLPAPILKQKLLNMCTAAKRCGCKKARCEPAEN